MAGPIASAGAEIKRVKRTKFLHLIVQPEENHPGPLNDLVSNDTWQPSHLFLDPTTVAGYGESQAK
jgi:hypothetical protein